ncbi:MAG: orotidine-5'-phosphate decarboxylase [Candidatus Kerfeldbacteria bacterium]|nr:orotidine-5'-phosphate decarboxylase [Candidatus Kerfeldbacteria bacterium]
MNYQDRIQLTTNATAKRLFEIMAEKETNLAVAADLTDANDIIRLAQIIGDDICVLKTHIDVVTNCSNDFINSLVELSQQHKFLIFEDRKFADIGNTVQLQYGQGLYHMVDWSDIINAHVVPGPGVIEGLRAVGLEKGRGLLLIGEMSSAGNLATGEYTQAALRWAEQYSDFVIGFIGMKRLVDDPKFITMTPGVNLADKGDDLKQQYVSPEQAIQGGSDVIIVGRGIYGAIDSAAAAKQYRQAGWKAYLRQS